MQSIAAAARRLGAGDFSARTHAVGPVELVDIADALNLAAGRIGELVALERQFSFDASHQLRSPVTALQLRLDELSAMDHPDAARADLDSCQGLTSRLTSTISDLLELRRQGRTGPPSRIDLASLVRATSPTPKRPTGPPGGSGGRSSAPARSPMPPRGPSARPSMSWSTTPLRHGAGTATVELAPDTSGATISVTDEGSLPVHAHQVPFSRSVPDHPHGLGLVLARTLIESEGSQLLLEGTDPPALRSASRWPTSPSLKGAVREGELVSQLAWVAARRQFMSTATTKTG